MVLGSTAPALELWLCSERSQHALLMIIYTWPIYVTLISILVEDESDALKFNEWSDEVKIADQPKDYRDMTRSAWARIGFKL